MVSHSARKFGTSPKQLFFVNVSHNSWNKTPNNNFIYEHYSEYLIRNTRFHASNNIGLLNWYWWILARAGCKMPELARAIQSQRVSIFTIDISSITPFFIYLKLCSVNLHIFWVKFISDSYVEWWYFIWRYRGALYYMM